MKGQEKELKNLFKKMANKHNFINIDEVYLSDYSDPTESYLVGNSVISDRSGSKNITSLIKATMKDAGIKPNTNVNHALLHIEVPRKAQLQKVINIVADLKGHLKCNFNFSVATSASKSIRLSIIAQKNT